MMKSNSLLTRTTVCAFALACAGISTPPAQARDKEFGLLVHYVESHYHAHRQYRFLLGFASIAVNIAHPYGVKGMKLALWENARIADLKDDEDFTEVVKKGLAEGWQPMVRVWSRHSGERTVIFAKPDRNDMKLLVATVDQEDAVVVQVKINPDKLSNYIDDWTSDRKRGHPRNEMENETPSPGSPDAVAENAADGK